MIKISRALILALSMLLLGTAGAACPSARAAEAAQVWELPAPKDLEGLKDYTVMLREGKVCVLDPQGKTVYVTDVKETDLRESDRQLLKKGVPVADYGTLLRLIEDYNS